MEKSINGKNVKIIMIGPLIKIPKDIAIQKKILFGKLSFLKLISLQIIKLHIPINKKSKPSVFAWWISDIVRKEKIKKNIVKNAIDSFSIFLIITKIKKKLIKTPNIDGNLYIEILSYG